MTRKISITGMVLAMTILCVAVRTVLAGGALPPFRRDVAFEKSVPDLTADTLRGKGALIIFFQSWCPICNGWSGNLLRQVEEAHGGNPGLMLVAIKTDGGGVKAAEAYLKEKGADPDLWFIGSDEGAAYYKKLTGKNELWGYAIVNTDGAVAEIGKAGAYWTTGKDKGKFTLSSPDVVKKCGKIQTLLPADGKYPGELARIARVAELGALGQAMKACGSAAAKSRHKEEAAKLLAALESSVKARLEALMQTGRDEKADAGARYEAYKELAALAKELSGQPAAVEAGKVLGAMGQDPALRKEKAAEDEYRQLSAKLAKASARSKPLVAKELKRVGDKYPGTLYGKRAVEDAEQAAADDAPRGKTRP